jgi:hypothetical protein
VRTALTLLIFAALFVTLTVTSYTRESATWDEPTHLASGYVVLTRNDYRIDPDHPPFLRAWAALPLLLTSGVRVHEGAASWRSGDTFAFSHEFTYRWNDADRMLYRARLMIVLLGLLLGVLLFLWVRDLFGFAPAAFALALYTMEPNLLAHSRLVTTDLGLTCFAFGAVYFLWRCCRELRPGNVAGLLVMVCLASVSKFSAPLLALVVLALLLVRAVGRKPWAWAFGGEGSVETRGGRLLVAVGVFLLLAVAAFASIWAAYGFRYAPTKHGDDAVYRPSLIAAERSPGLTDAVEWADRNRLLPNAYLQGFLQAVSKSKRRASFLMGEYAAEGWWFYFPAAFAMKTPLAVLLVLVGGLVLSIRRARISAADDAFLLLPLGAFLAAAMAGSLNIGLRHILPIYPFALLLCARAAGALLESRRAWSRALLGAALLLSAAELARVGTHHLAFFNAFAGGPAKGHERLADSNVDWGQDLKGLAGWMEAEGVGHVNLSYFGTADPAYYGIDCTHLPGSPYFAESRISEPRLPGYVAISATNLVGTYFNDRGREFYRPLRDREPVAVIGHSIFVYRVDSPEW